MARASRYEDSRDGILLWIREAELAHRRPPTVRDLAAMAEVSVSTMHSYLKQLAEEGLVQWSKGRHRSLSCTQSAIQLLSSRAAS